MSLATAQGYYNYIVSARNNAEAWVNKANQTKNWKDIATAEYWIGEYQATLEDYQYEINTVPNAQRSQLKQLPPPPPSLGGQQPTQTTTQPAAQTTTAGGGTTGGGTVTQAESVPSYAATPRTESDYINAIKYYGQKNGVNLNDNDIKIIAYAYGGTPNISALVTGLNSGGIDPSSKFYPTNIAKDYVNNKEQYVNDAIQQLTKYSLMYQYQSSVNKTGSSADYASVAQASADKLKELVTDSIQSGAISPAKAQESVNQAVDYMDKAVDQFAKEKDGGLFALAVKLGANAIVGAGLGSFTLPQQIAATSVMQLAQGVNPQDIVRNAVATIASNAVTQGIPGVDASKVIPETLNKLNQQIASLAPGMVSPTVMSALVNAERQSVAALITKQDVAQNAIAGAAGGTMADLVGVGLYKLSPTMSEALQKSLARAAAEYTQYKTAGFSDAEALQKATTGYLSEQQKIESAAAKEKQQTAGLSEEQVGVAQKYGQSAAFPTAQAGQFTGTEPGEKTLATQYSDTTAIPSGTDLSVISTPSGFQGRAISRGGQLPEKIVTAKESLPGGTTTDTAGEDLSLISSDTTPTEKTPEQIRQDMILTSLINKNVSTPLYSNKTKATQGTTGTAALAQALRVGDIGAPIFGREEEGRRAGWNLQSLRYMGDVGAEK